MPTMVPYSLPSPGIQLLYYDQYDTIHFLIIFYYFLQTLASGKFSWKYVGSHDNSTKKQLFWQACVITMAQNDDFRNKINHGTDEFIFTLFTHNLLGTETLMIRFRSDDIA